MALPTTAFQANSVSFSQASALQANANAKFLSQSTIAINNAQAQGLYFTTLRTFKDCSIVNILNYFTGLGYGIRLLDLHFQNGFQETPFNLFGMDYVTWLNNMNGFEHVSNPTRIRIEWNLPNHAPVIPVISTQNTSYTMLKNNETVYGDTSGHDVVLSLPLAPMDGWVETVFKAADAHTLLVDGNGNLINGASAQFSIVNKNASVSFIFMAGIGWVSIQ